MNRTREAIELSVRLGVEKHSNRFALYLSIPYPCSSVCIRGSKEFGEMLR
jgi:hypothetical protein